MSPDPLPIPQFLQTTLTLPEIERSPLNQRCDWTLYKSILKMRLGNLLATDRPCSWRLSSLASAALFECCQPLRKRTISRLFGRHESKSRRRSYGGQPFSGKSEKFVSARSLH